MAFNQVLQRVMISEGGNGVFRASLRKNSTRANIFLIFERELNG